MNRRSFFASLIGVCIAVFWPRSARSYKADGLIGHWDTAQDVYERICQVHSSNRESLKIFDGLPWVIEKHVLPGQEGREGAYWCKRISDPDRVMIVGRSDQIIVEHLRYMAGYYTKPPFFPH